MKSLLKNVIPAIFFDWYHKFWPLLGVVIYGRPSIKIKIIGVTGTTGKTTVVHLVSDILEAAGYKVASISSLRFKIGKKEWKNELKMTMPGRMTIQKFLRNAVNEGCDYAVLEITSEGIKQHRHDFIDFDVAVFTNLKPEHIERHGGFENYKKAKGELFKAAKSAVINLDDENAEYFSSLCKGKKWGYSIKSNVIDFKLSLPGEFNLYNALAAAYTGMSQGVDVKIIKSALENAKGIPGRMEVVIYEPYTVIVDYAHTPDALEKVYKTIQDTYKLSPYGGSPAGRQTIPPRGISRRETNYKLVCVLGAAGGGRDKWKRPQMGKVAMHYCDEIILTNEDPYDEDPSQILSEIKSGISNSQFPISKLHEILDRREAIKKALGDARRGDTVAITGKGAEPWIMTKLGRIPWDDRKIVLDVLSNP